MIVSHIITAHRKIALPGFAVAHSIGGSTGSFVASRRFRTAPL
ncbi:MAG TPA: hypothetical protein VF592_08590 [Sphingomonas sp.]|jgi:hypothetical protein